MTFSRSLIAVLAAAFISACGGGGSSAPPVVTPPPPPVVVAPPPYTFTPATLRASYVAGYPVTVQLVAKQTVAFVGIAYLKVVPDDAVIDPAIMVTPLADGTFTVQAKTTASAKPGHYTGNITINVCTDANCTSHLAGSPFKLPYDIDVISPDGGVTISNSSALSSLAGAPDWETFQGNAQHTGYVPVSLTPASFSRRWKWVAASVAGQPLKQSTIATGAGMFYVATGDSFSPKGSSSITAYREFDGSKVWTHSFDDLRWPSTNPPAFTGGRVFISAGSQESTAMFAFDALGGNQLFKSAMSSQWEHYLAPTVYNGRVYTDGGTYGGLFSFDATSGANKFFASLGQYDGWTPALDANNLYAYVGGSLYLRDPAAGTARGSIPDPTYSWNGYTTGGAPVVGSGGMVYAGNLSNASKNSIVGFDTVAKTARWSVNGAYPGNPAYADSLLFTANNATAMVEVLNESDGKIAWSWSAPADDRKFVSDVLVTRNLVFVSTDRTTFAIDRTSHKTVWTEPAGGKLALSANGILYIKDDTTIVAVNLK